jgi:hypothetical protein
VTRARMKSHALDAFSLVAGLLFVAVGALVAVDASASRDVDPRWILAVLLVGLGLAGVLGSLDWSRRGAEPAERDSEDPPHPPKLEKEWT